MSLIIEILDSDDSSDDGNSENEIVLQQIEYSENSQSAESDKVSGSIEPATPAPTPPPAAGVASVSDEALPPNVRRSKSRRKTAHQLIRTSPEIEFQTIALEGATKGGAANVRPADGREKPKAKDRQHKQPNILAQKTPNVSELISVAQMNFLAKSETSQVLKRIAKERVRVNYLLNLFGMPEINFSMHTQPERLQFQFEDRLKQRRMRNIDAVRLQASKRRRPNATQPTSTITTATTSPTQ